MLLKALIFVAALAAVCSSVTKTTDPVIEAKFGATFHSSFVRDKDKFEVDFSQYISGDRVVATVVKMWVSELGEESQPWEDWPTGDLNNRLVKDNGAAMFEILRQNQGQLTKVAETIEAEKLLGYGQVFFVGGQPENIRFATPIHIDGVTFKKKIFHSNKKGRIVASVVPGLSQGGELGWACSVHSDLAAGENYQAEQEVALLKELTGSNKLSSNAAQVLGQSLAARSQKESPVEFFVGLSRRTLLEVADPSGLSSGKGNLYV